MKDNMIPRMGRGDDKNNNIASAHEKKLHQLFFPIFFETLFMMLAGMVDTLMLSSEGDCVVGAVGTANTYIGLLLIMFSIISSGMVAVMTQYIGATRPGVARQALKIGLMINTFMGVAVTVIMVFGAEPILNAVGIARDLEEPARIYLQAIGFFTLCNAITPLVSSYLRSFGHTAPSMVATFVSNILNVGLNAIFLFVLDMGVLGVALATGISRLVNLLWVCIVAKKLIKVERDDDTPTDKEIFGKIIKVGLPAAMEMMLYNLAMTFILSMLNGMDDTGMQATARAYALQISNFSYCVSVSLANANAVLVGWHLGAEKYERCIRSTRKSAILGICSGVIVAGVFAIFADQIVGLFTKDPGMVELVGTLLALNIILEIGRASNLVYGFALKTSGDAVFPMVIAVVFMFLFAVGGTWFFGIQKGMLVVGAYLGMTLDECIRSILMCARWRSGRWKQLKLVGNKQ